MYVLETSVLTGVVCCFRHHIIPTSSAKHSSPAGAFIVPVSPSGFRVLLPSVCCYCSARFLRLSSHASTHVATRIASHHTPSAPSPPSLSLPTPSPPTHTHQPKLTPLSPTQVTDTRPPTSRFHIPSPTSVPKYTMPPSEYATRPDSVLAWKKAHQLGRFDPHAPDAERAKVEAGEREIRERG